MLSLSTASTLTERGMVWSSCGWIFSTLFAVHFCHAVVVVVGGRVGVGDVIVDVVDRIRSFIFYLSIFCIYATSRGSVLFLAVGFCRRFSIFCTLK